VRPVSGVMRFDAENEQVAALGQSEYVPLPVVVLKERFGEPVFSRWHLSEGERMKISAGADIVLSLLAFGKPIQPVHLQVCRWDEAPNLDHVPVQPACSCGQTMKNTSFDALDETCGLVANVTAYTCSTDGCVGNIAQRCALKIEEWRSSRG